jgi:hypothetical protein
VNRTLGLPLKCPKCPSKNYFGVLKAPQVPTVLVKLDGRSDVCPTCETALIPAVRGVSAHQKAS